MCHNLGLGLNYIDVTKNTYIGMNSYGDVDERKCGLSAVPLTVPA
jgi:hypothetical protein